MKALNVFTSLLLSRIDDDRSNEFKKSLTFLKRSRSVNSMGSEKDGDASAQDSSSDGMNWQRILKVAKDIDVASYRGSSEDAESN